MPIERIRFAGQKELAWDWEVYHDPSAENFPDPQKSVCTFDNPFNPWRNVNGECFVIAANIVNYRVPLDSNLRPLRVLDQGDIVFHSGRTYPHPNRPERYYHRGYGRNLVAGSCVEADYDHNFWVFSPWTADGYTFSALCHHEFYPDSCPNATTEHWINTIHQMFSFDGGQTFLPQPYHPYDDNGGRSNSWRTVLIPEPSHMRPWPPKINYGFYHPSNIVSEGAYCYALCTASNWLGQTYQNDGIQCLNQGGFAMIRTQHPGHPRAWEVFTALGWKAIDVNTWQGWRIDGVGGQTVKLWHREEYCPYQQFPTKGQLLGYRLVYHQTAQQWIALGYANRGARTVCYTLSDSLASPNWEQHGISLVEDGPNSEHVVPNTTYYPSIVDPTSSGYVFQFTGNNPFLYFVDPDPASRTNLHSRSIWRIPLQIET